MEVDQHVQSDKDNATKRTHICTTKSTFSPLGYQCDVQSDTPTSAMQTPPFLEFCNSALIIEVVCQRHSLPLCTLQSSARLCATCLMFLERSDCTQKESPSVSLPIVFRQIFVRCI